MAPRRVANEEALRHCPVGRWLAVDEFSRYMRAANFDFSGVHEPWSLYVCSRDYGKLGYEGYGGWNILQDRYIFTLLMEYAATLGIVDVAFCAPEKARRDFRGMWGTDDLRFLSRYDGLRHIRLTPPGAYILGLADEYRPTRKERKGAENRRQRDADRMPRCRGRRDDRRPQGNRFLVQAYRRKDAGGAQRTAGKIPRARAEIPHGGLRAIIDQGRRSLSDRPADRASGSATRTALPGRRV